jgi:hypothetical protein
MSELERLAEENDRLVAALRLVIGRLIKTHVFNSAEHSYERLGN